MTTESHVESVDTPDPEGEGPEDSAVIKQLRQQNKDLHKALEASAPVVMREAMRELGIDPKSKDGKFLAAVAESRKIPVTLDSLTALATEFEVEVGGSGEGGEGDGGRGPGPQGTTDTEADRQRQQTQGGVDEINEAGTSVPAVENREALLAKIDEAHAAGDTFTVISLQRQLTDVPKVR